MPDGHCRPSYSPRIPAFALPLSPLGNPPPPPRLPSPLCLGFLRGCLNRPLPHLCRPFPPRTPPALPLDAMSVGDPPRQPAAGPPSTPVGRRRQQHRGRPDAFGRGGGVGAVAIAANTATDAATLRSSTARAPATARRHFPACRGGGARGDGGGSGGRGGRLLPAIRGTPPRRVERRASPTATAVAVVVSAAVGAGVAAPAAASRLPLSAVGARVDGGGGEAAAAAERSPLLAPPSLSLASAPPLSPLPFPVTPLWAPAVMRNDVTNGGGGAVSAPLAVGWVLAAAAAGGVVLLALTLCGVWLARRRGQARAVTGGGGVGGGDGGSGGVVKWGGAGGMLGLGGGAAAAARMSGRRMWGRRIERAMEGGECGGGRRRAWGAPRGPACQE